MTRAAVCCCLQCGHESFRELQLLTGLEVRARMEPAAGNGSMHHSQGVMPPGPAFNFLPIISNSLRTAAIDHYPVPRSPRQQVQKDRDVHDVVI